MARGGDRNPPGHMDRRQFIVRSLGSSAACGLPGAGFGSDEAASPPDALRVDADFPGGNVRLGGIRKDGIEVAPDLRDTKGNWFYWNFRVRGAGGRTLRFEFPNERLIGARGPAISVDGGRTWRWQGEAFPASASFEHAFDGMVAETRFAMTFPYTVADLDEFLRGREGKGNLERQVLCRSRKGREIPLLKLGRLDDGFSCSLLVTARQHACETMASFVVEGLIDAVLADDATGQWLREHARIHVVPLTDFDGVEDGDQGKNRTPYDHNRDYGEGEDPLYPEVGEIRRLAPIWSGSRPWVFMDMHCPYIRGGINEVVYQVGSVDPKHWERQQVFARLVEAERRGALLYSPSDDLPFGVSWNVAAAGLAKTAASWMSRQAGNELSTTWEIPYANAGGAEVNVTSCRDFGAGLAAAVRRYLGERVLREGA